MGFKAPGSGAPASSQTDGYKLADLDGHHVIISNVEHGSSVTQFSEGETRAYVDVDVLVLDGPNQGEKRRSRLFGGYVVSDLRGFGPGDEVLAKVGKGSPRAGLREGWLLTEVTDPNIIATAEAISAVSAPF